MYRRFTDGDNDVAVINDVFFEGSVILDSWTEKTWLIGSQSCPRPNIQFASPSCGLYFLPRIWTLHCVHIFYPLLILGIIMKVGKLLPGCIASVWSSNFSTICILQIPTKITRNWTVARERGSVTTSCRLEISVGCDDWTFIAVSDKTPLPSVVHLVLLQEDSVTRSIFLLTFKFLKVEYPYYRTLTEEISFTFMWDDTLIKFSKFEKIIHLESQSLLSPSPGKLSESDIPDS